MSSIATVTVEQHGKNIDMYPSGANSIKVMPYVLPFTFPSWLLPYGLTKPEYGVGLPPRNGGAKAVLLLHDLSKWPSAP